MVHYQLPAAADVYVHRCGRTGRAAAEGISVALVVSKEVARFTALWKVNASVQKPSAVVRLVVAIISYSAFYAEQDAKCGMLQGFAAFCSEIFHLLQNIILSSKEFHYLRLKDASSLT